MHWWQLAHGRKVVAALEKENIRLVGKARPSWQPRARSH
jgi:hypothetical protein